MGQDESCQPIRQEFTLPVSANLPVITIQSGLVEVGPVMAGPGRSCPCCRPPGLLSHQGQGRFRTYKTHFLPQDLPEQ